MKNCKKIKSNFAQKCVKTASAIIALVSSITFCAVISYNNILPDEVRIYENDSVKFDNNLTVSKAGANFASVGENHDANIDNSYDVTVKLYGIVPIKQVSVAKIEEMQVVVSGKPFGIKIFTNGVMVVGMSDIEIGGKKYNPAYKAGIRIGDVIKTLGGYEVASNEDVADVFEGSGGKSVVAKVVRDGKNYTFSIKPIYNETDGKYKAGIWVRDSSAGIGTMTFYSPTDGSFAGLGHAICDVDTGKILPLESGEIVNANINAVVKSENGKTGELCGAFSSGRIGALYTNCSDGLYGRLDEYEKNGRLVSIATKNEVKTGKAKIYANTDNSGPKMYDCVIERIDKSKNAEHSMVVRITDSRLIEKTGGIVQGMSGSPILQDGKLVGAVTHVFVNSSDKGYAIFAEKMYYQMKSSCGEKGDK